MSNKKTEQEQEQEQEQEAHFSHRQNLPRSSIPTEAHFVSAAQCKFGFQSPAPISKKIESCERCVVF